LKGQHLAGEVKRNASAVTNQEIMSSPSEAADMMLQHNVKHLLVVDRGDSSNSNKPVGIITPLDFIRYQEYANDKE
jgi:CBS domain-containing protein